MRKNLPWFFIMKYLAVILVIVSISSVFAKTDTVPYNNELYNEYTILPSDIPHNAPHFEDFPTKLYSGRLATPMIDANPETRLFRTRIREGAKERKNLFAGHFVIAFWGCGTDCTQLAIIDAKSGKVFHPKGLGYYVTVNIHDDLHGKTFEFRPNSRMIRVIGMLEEDEKRHGISYYVWQKNHLSLIGFVPKPWYKCSEINGELKCK